MASDLLSRIGGATVELARHRVVAEFEPDKDHFRTRSGQLSAITKILRVLPHDEVREFCTPKGRDDFLFATPNYLTERDDHEELVVAFGSRRGRSRNAGACLRRVHKSGGERARRAHANATRATRSGDAQGRGRDHPCAQSSAEPHQDGPRRALRWVETYRLHPSSTARDAVFAVAHRTPLHECEAIFPKVVPR